MRTRQVSLAVVLLLSLSATAFTPARATPMTTAASTEVPDIFPLRAVEPGMTAVVHATMRSDTITRFTVRVVDVAKDGIAPGYDMILVRLTKKSRETVPGFFAGISGAPVYIGDRLLGAASYGFCCGDARHLGGITPAKYLVDVLDMRTPVSQREAVRVPAAPSISVRGMAPIATPLVVSGVRPERIPLLQQRFGDLMGGPVIMIRGGSSSASDEPTPLRPGSPAAVVLSSGDFSFGAVGTTTLRVGNRVVVFGHPFMFDGPTRAGLASAHVSTVVNDQVLGPYVLASLGDLSGTIVQDRMAGVAGVIGREMPSTVVRANLRNVELGTRRRGQSVVAQRSTMLAGLASSALLSGADATFNRIGSGSADVALRIEGTRAGGAPFTYTFTNLVDSSWDLTISMVDPMWLLLDAIDNNAFEAVRITDVELAGALSTRRRSATISAVAVTAGAADAPVSEGPVVAQPGDTLAVDVTLRGRRAAPVIKTLLITVPDVEGQYALSVRGGGSETGFEPEPVPSPGQQPSSFDELLAQLEAIPHNNDIVARLFSFDEMTGRETDWSSGVSTAKRVISGERYFDVIVGEPPIEEPPELTEPSIPE